MADRERPPDAPPGHGVHRPSAPRPDYPAAPGSRDTYAGDPNAGDPYAGDPYAGDPYAGGAAWRPGAPASATRRRRGWLRPLLLLLVLAVIVYPLALGALAWTSLGRTAALGDSSTSTPGRTYLVVGSDSRAGLTAAQRKRLRTGSTAGQRTDTILLLHVPRGRGPTVLMSVPRDSYVPIPGHGSNKLNAAFSLGGPKLLARTLEQSTGIEIDDYVEIGFAGFAGMVDALGGVQICPTFAMKDPRAGLDLKKGCQQADGATGLGYARARYSDPRGDLGRVERQRELLAAIVSKATSPATLVNPLRTVPLARSGAGALTVDESTGPYALARFVLGMKQSAGSSGIALTVPVRGTASRPGAGSVVLWDTDKASAVFDAIKRDDTEAVRAFAPKR